MKKMIKAYIMYCLAVITAISVSYITNVFHFSATTFIVGLIVGIVLNKYMEE